MATIDLTNLMQPLSGGSAGTVDFASYILHGSTYYTWRTTDGHIVTAQGTGITVDGSNIPTGGTIETITIDMANNNPSTPDLVITGLSFDLSDLVYASGLDSANAFWALVLAGETTVLPGATDSFGLFGDYRDFNLPGIGIAGDDTLTGADNSGTLLYGDALSVTSGLLRAGDDVINGTFQSATGDALSVLAGARLVGGHDRIILQTNLTASLTLIATGDAQTVAGTLIAGDDFIDGRVGLIGGIANFRGDVITVQAGGLVQGGNDVMYGSLGDDAMYGDAINVDSGGLLIGGDDTIYGEDDNDSIAGDAVNNFGITIGGHDSLFGGDGDDSMFGDVAFSASEGGNDYLNGQRGNDTLFGNEGDDTLYGGANEDSLLGESGNDRLFGENGRDTLSGGQGNDVLGGGNGNDLLFGDAGNDTLRGGDANDTLNGGTNEDRLEGGTGHDVLSGDNGSDLLYGNGGNDSLIGGNAHDTLCGGGNEDSLVGGNGHDDLQGDNGHDTLSGDAGRDTLNGGNGHDSLTGGAESDVFVFVGGFGNDTITDFDAFDDAEVIDLSGVAAITDFADLTNAGNPHMTQDGFDVVIDDFAGNTIRLESVSLSDLDAADFVFV